MKKTQQSFLFVWRNKSQFAKLGNQNLKKPNYKNNEGQIKYELEIEIRKY